MAKFSIFSWFSYPLSLNERLRLIRQAGFEATTLWWDEDDRDEHPDLARRLGLEVENIHAPFMDAHAFWQDTLNGAGYQAMLLGCVEACARHQIPTVVIHAMGEDEPATLDPIGLKRLDELVERAERHQVNLAFENLAYFRPLAGIFAHVQSERAGFCFDSGHEHCARPAVDYLSLYGSKLFAVHLADNHGSCDSHLLPFDGTIDWQALHCRLAVSRPLDFVTLEVGYDRRHTESRIYRELTAEAYLALAYERLQRFCAVGDEPAKTGR